MLLNSSRIFLGRQMFHYKTLGSRAVTVAQSLPCGTVRIRPSAWNVYKTRGYDVERNNYSGFKTNLDRPGNFIKTNRIILRTKEQCQSLPKELWS